jgi:hypothetical protein
MTKRKQTKGQTMIYKTLHRQRNTLIINNSIKIRKRTQVLWEGKQFLLHQWHLLCLLVVCILFYCITSTHMLLSYIFKNITWTTNKSSAVLDNRVMVLNTTYNYISVISWRSVFYWWKNRSIGNNHRPPASHWQTLSHNIVSGTPHQELWTKTTNVIEYIKERVLTATIVIWFCNSITRMKYKINKFCIRNVTLSIQWSLGLWCLEHFQQYFSYIEAVSFIDGGNGVPSENHWPVARHWQT